MRCELIFAGGMNKQLTGRDWNFSGKPGCAAAPSSSDPSEHSSHSDTPSPPPPPHTPPTHALPFQLLAFLCFSASYQAFIVRDTELWPFGFLQTGKGCKSVEGSSCSSIMSANGSLGSRGRKELWAKLAPVGDWAVLGTGAACLGRGTGYLSKP